MTSFKEIKMTENYYSGKKYIILIIININTFQNNKEFLQIKESYVYFDIVVSDSPSVISFILRFIQILIFQCV